MTRLVICEMCDNPMEDEGLPLCPRCELHTGEESCVSCGGQLMSDGSCSCDLNRPPADAQHWKNHV